MNSLWDKHECVAGRFYTCAFAQLRLWLVRNRQGWSVATLHQAESVFEPFHETAVEPEGLEWLRFVTPSETTTVRFVPVLPDRPVVSRPEVRIEIAPRHKCLFL